jgi:hypothetical protein
MSGVIPPLPQYAFMEWCLVKAQGQLYLYLFTMINNNENGMGRSDLHLSEHTKCLCLQIFEETYKVDGINDFLSTQDSSI